MPLDAPSLHLWRVSRRLIRAAFQRHCEPINFSTAMVPTLEKRGSRNMSSQEELVDGLRQLTEALALHRARRLSIVRDDNKPLVARAPEALSGLIETL
jgi:hypothetical protein